MKKIIICFILSILSSAYASPPEFSWYDLRDSLDRKNKSQSSNKSDSDNSTQKMIFNRYGVLTSKKSINQIIEDQTKSSLSIGLEMQSNPTYTQESFDISNPSVPIITSDSLPGTAIYIKGTLDFSPIGASSVDLNAKVALSNDAVDFDVNKRLLGTKYSTMSMDAGLGLKAVTAENAVFQKGFHGYLTTSLNYLTDDYQFHTGVRALMSKPDAYNSTSDIVSPFIGGGLRF